MSASSTMARRRLLERNAIVVLALRQLLAGARLLASNGNGAVVKQLRLWPLDDQPPPLGWLPARLRSAGAGVDDSDALADLRLLLSDRVSRHRMERVPGELDPGRDHFSVLGRTFFREYGEDGVRPAV